jgi:peptidoglycan/xylan/chitin deacetylase (PgdA/CDA1 family)
MLDAAHPQYPMLRQGMDHGRYAFSQLHERAPLRWPQGKPLALWINLSIEHFPLNPSGKPVKLPGNMTMPYPDLRHFTLRDYGNRVGVYRIFKALDQFNAKASTAINAEAVERFPYLMDMIASRGHEVLGHSWNMDTAHAGGLAKDAEAELIEKSFATLQSRFGKPVQGWLSPGKLQSPHTPDLLAAQGIRYCCDWVNDDMPYRFHTAAGELWNLPLSTELEDRFVLLDNLHSAQSWSLQVMDAMTLLLAEAKRRNSPRMLGLNIHPWVMGQPHRMKHFEAVLAFAAAHPADVEFVMPSDVVFCAAG